MHVIKINRREARLLRENLTGNQDGYDYTDLCRLDHLAKKLTALQGEYGECMAVLAREEKQANRKIARQIDIDAANRALLDIQCKAEDLNESAEAVQVEFEIEDADYKLITYKLGMVTHWLANDDFRHVIIGMMEAVKNATTDTEQEPKIKAIKR